MKKVKPGDPLVIPAPTSNTFVDAARDFLARQHQQAQAGTPSGKHNCIVPAINRLVASGSEWRVHRKGFRRSGPCGRRRGRSGSS
ncbi:MAG TPA: hypothetical protein PLC79_00445 [Phycisphaerae bacterium]|nr:hypothetical protein [Phycisphaerae bacterium]